MGKKELSIVFDVKGKFNFEKIRKKIEEEERKEARNAKSLSELVLPFEFEVESVLLENEAITNSVGRIVIGGRGENILTYLAKTIISVSPYDKSCPIKTLNFHGFSSVRTGDRIICEVSLFQKKRFSYYNPEDEFYFPRNPEVEEEAVQIEIVKGRRTERSVNYERFYR